MKYAVELEQVFSLPQGWTLDNPNNRLKANSVRTTSRKTTSKMRDFYLNSSGRKIVILTTKIKGRAQEILSVQVQVM